MDKKNSLWKRRLKKVWHFIWEEDSAASWIVNIILAFIIIKFAVYPILGLIFSTNFPIVAVVSGSMEHAYAPKVDDMGNYITTGDGQLIYSFCKETYTKDRSFLNLRDFKKFDTFWNVCGSWYEDINITKEQFRQFRFTNGFNRGDIMILHGTNIENIKVGDIVVFQGRIKSEPVIHRVVKVSKKNNEVHLTTKGDHNHDIFYQSGENNITQDEYIAKAVMKVPYLGWIKIIFTYFTNGFKPIR